MNDETQHQVSLPQPFYIGVFEVTQAQWERVMGTWPSRFNTHPYCDSQPVEQISYSDIRGLSAGTNWPANNAVDADSFMGQLRSRTGRMFDLPTEAQWEYAGRAGTTTALNSGRNLDGIVMSAKVAAVGRHWYIVNAFGREMGMPHMTAKVGSYKPNNWGLYDIHGNVWEWCLDWFPKYMGLHRVIRGGSWYCDASYCRMASRIGASPGHRLRFIGFRVVLPLGLVDSSGQLIENADKMITDNHSHDSEPMEKNSNR